MRDLLALSDDDVIAEVGRVGSDVLGAVHWAMIEHDLHERARVRTASSSIVAGLQRGALGLPDSPVRRCLGSSEGVVAEFHPSNGWYDSHGTASLNCGIHHEYAVPLGDIGGVFGAFVWSRAHELPAQSEVVEAMEIVVAAAGVRLGLGRSLSAATTLVGQLTAALSTRTTIEQAKGLLAGREGIDLDEAFEGLRGAARRSGRRLQDIAAEVLARPSAVAQPGTIARRTGRSQPG